MHFQIIMSDVLQLSKLFLDPVNLIYRLSSVVLDLTHNLIIGLWHFLYAYIVSKTLDSFGLNHENYLRV